MLPIIFYLWFSHFLERVIIPLDNFDIDNSVNIAHIIENFQDQINVEV